MMLEPGVWNCTFAPDACSAEISVWVGAIGPVVEYASPPLNPGL